MQHIYLFHTGGAIRSNEKVYKIGKTTKSVHKRRAQYGGYDKGTEIKSVWTCVNCDEAERLVIKKFDEKFIKRTDLGNEYYEGDLFEMQRLAGTIINEQVNVFDNRSLNIDFVKKEFDNFYSKKI